MKKNILLWLYVRICVQNTYIYIRNQPGKWPDFLTLFSPKTLTTMPKSLLVFAKRYVATTAGPKKIYVLAENYLGSNYFTWGPFKVSPEETIEYLPTYGKESFGWLEKQGLAKIFNTCKEARAWIEQDTESMENAEEYARQAEARYDRYGCEGVDEDW